MAELPPRLQELLLKTNKAFEEADLPAAITIGHNQIEVTTQQDSYKLRIPRTRYRTADLLTERTTKQLLKYQKDILHAEPRPFQFAEQNGTLEEKIEHYLAYIEGSEDNPLKLEAYYLLGKLVQLYIEWPKDLKTIYKILRKKEQSPSKIMKIANRAVVLVQTRGQHTNYDYQCITPWVLYQMSSTTWNTLLDTAFMTQSIELIDTRELDSESREMLPTDPTSPPFSPIN